MVSDESKSLALGAYDIRGDWYQISQF
jgi:hypothetical protein